MDASGSGAEHLFHHGCDEWSEAVGKYEAGYRWFDSTTGTFYRSKLMQGTRSAPRSGTSTSRKAPAEPKGKRGWINLDGNETPAAGRDRSSLVVRMSLPVRSKLLRLAEQSDEDGDETGGFLFGRSSMRRDSAPLICRG